MSVNKLDDSAPSPAASVNASPSSSAASSGPASTHPAYRPDIDGLRAVAVVSVLIYHAFPAALGGGFAGVDIFFVISGFLITTIILKSLEKRAFSLADFYARRIMRLFPSLLAMMLLVPVLAAFVLLPADYAALGRNTVGGAAFVANILFAMDTGYFMGIAEANPLLHLWSLGIEEQFYLVWPLILWLSWRKGWHLGLVMLALIAASFVHSVYMVEYNPSLAFYSPLVRLWELASGGMLAWLTLNPQPWLARCMAWVDRRIGMPPFRAREPLQGLRDVASLGGLVLVTISFFTLVPAGNFPGAGALMPVVGAVLLIAAGPRAVVNRLVLSRRWMVGVGLISYPLYLWHWPLLALVFTSSTGASEVALRNSLWAAVLMSFVLAWLSYRYLETPLRRGEGSRRLKVSLLAGLMLLVVLMGAAMWASKGWPERIPEKLRPFVADNFRDDVWISGLRGGVCHNALHTGKGLDPQGKCFLEEGHPRILLWGDSHAASLFVGLEALQDLHQFSLWQTTADATAPIFSEDLRNNMQFTLKLINDHVIEQIQQRPPDVVLLHGIWQGYGYGVEDMAKRIRHAVDVIREATPGSRIVVLGPVPTWHGTLQQNILNYYWRHGAELPGERMWFGVKRDVFDYDAMLGERVRAAGAEYISAMDRMCDAHGCLVRVGSEPSGVAYVDGQHLSAAGAIYLADKIGDILLR